MTISAAPALTVDERNDPYETKTLGKTAETTLDICYPTLVVH